MQYHSASKDDVERKVKTNLHMNTTSAALALLGRRNMMCKRISRTVRERVEQREVAKRVHALYWRQISGSRIEDR